MGRRGEKTGGFPEKEVANVPTHKNATAQTRLGLNVDLGRVITIAQSNFRLSVDRRYTDN